LYPGDTKVISETRKGKQANAGVQKFFRTVAQAVFTLPRKPSAKFGGALKISGTVVIFLRTCWIHTFG
jgi:hypothetical protein